MGQRTILERSHICTSSTMEKKGIESGRSVTYTEFDQILLINVREQLVLSHQGIIEGLIMYMGLDSSEPRYFIYKKNGKKSFHVNATDDIVCRVTANYSSVVCVVPTETNQGRKTCNFEQNRLYLLCGN